MTGPRSCSHGVLLNARHFAKGEAGVDISTRLRVSRLRTALDLQAQAQRERANLARPRALECEDEMLRIEKDCQGCVTRLRLSGRIESDHIASVQSAMSGCCDCKILDLSEVTLVDLVAVRFLISCEDEGVELVQCPPYVREWILRERAEGGQWENG